jgi:hypothetical protein
MSKKVKSNKLIYLACLYSLCADADLMQARFERVEKVSAILIKKGQMVFSPIVYNHAMAIRYDFPKTFGFWEGLDKTFINHCDELWILDGDMPWIKSIGVNAEFEYAKSLGLPVRLVKYDDKTNRYRTKEIKYE